MFCDNDRLNIGIIGYGNFGKLMTYHLSKFHNIYVYDKNINPKVKLPEKVHFTNLDKITDCKILIIAVAMGAFESVVKSIHNRLKPGTLIMEVTSVKIRPLEILEKYLSDDIEILGTHPLFGPQSTKDGIKGRKIALFPVRCSSTECIKKFLFDKLKLKILEMSPEQHDKEMAQVQALSHFVGHAFKKINLTDYKTNTATYNHLLTARDIVANDSDDLFNTIQNENPYASDMRNRFLDAIQATQEEILKCKKHL
ncbi:MAG TPA: prephenate dehydrogenase [Victivallales bacterium]|nr:prephenate dehydrogenase [Victivallales bacterium]